MKEIEKLQVDIRRFRDKDLDNATLKALLEDAYSKINELVDLLNELLQPDLDDEEIRERYEEVMSDEYN